MTETLPTWTEQDWADEMLDAEEDLRQDDDREPDPVWDWDERRDQ